MLQLYILTVYNYMHNGAKARIKLHYNLSLFILLFYLKLPKIKNKIEGVQICLIVAIP